MVIEEFISINAEKELVKMDQQACKTMEPQQSKSTLRILHKKGSPIDVQRALSAPESDFIYHSQSSPQINGTHNLKKATQQAIQDAIKRGK
jgi:hypothetical protein